MFLSQDTILEYNVHSVTIGVGLKDDSVASFDQTTEYIDSLDNREPHEFKSRRSQSSPDSLTLSYNVTLIQHDCSLWDTQLKKWTQSDTCQASEVFIDRVEVRSRQVGILTSTAYSPSNSTKLQPLGILDHKHAPTSPVVFISLLVLMTVYIITACKARITDIRDHKRWEIHPLMDNPKDSNYDYEIHVHTGTGLEGRTDHTVQFDLVGSSEATGVRQLGAAFRHQIFNSSCVTVFHMTTTHLLGDLRKLNIWLDMSKERRSKHRWKLNIVVIVDFYHKEWYIFNPDGKWVVRPPDKHERTLSAVNYAHHISKKSDLFLSNIRFYLVNVQLLLSIFTLQYRTNFSRVQRFLCCLLVLALSMLFTTVSQNSYTGPYVTVRGRRLYYETLVRACYAVLLSAPVSAAVAWFYGKCRLTPEDDEQHFLTHEPLASTRTASTWSHSWVVVLHVLMVLVNLLAVVTSIVLSMSWTNEEAVQWIATVLMTFLLTVVVLDTFKVLLLASLDTYVYVVDSTLHLYKDLYGEAK